MNYSVDQKNIEKNKKLNFIFFGTDDFSVNILKELKDCGFIPKIIVTAPDRPAGRGQKMKESSVKIWAKEISIKEDLNIKVLQPEHLDMSFLAEISKQKWNFFVTASYGKIIPQNVLEITERGAFNVHPSLLPLYRGASPVESAILNDNKETGVTIMLMDEKMDHGPILNQEVVYFEEWPTKLEVEEKLAVFGGRLLAQTINPYLNNEIEEQEQDHNTATFTKKITKEIGEIKFEDILKASNDKKLGREIFIKIQALNPWPGVFFFIKHDDKEIRIKIKEASWITPPDNTESKAGKLQIIKVLPEGKKEMNYEDFLRGYVK